MPRHFIAIIALFLWTSSLAQKSHLHLDYQLVVDNDAFTLDLTQDQYYSSGIYPQVRWLADSSQNAKRIFSVKLNHRMFTASWIGWKNLDQLDRPYAGQISASFASEWYFHGNRYLRTALEVGWMGPGSGVGETQTTWHRWFGMPRPEGWQFQINDTPLINAHLKHIKPFYSTPGIEMTSETSLTFGTTQSFLRQDFMLRMGKLLPMHQSAVVSSSLGNRRRPKSSFLNTVESYFFYSPGLEYVFYNGTIEGNFLGTPSIYTEEAIRWVWQHRLGVLWSWPRFDFGFTIYWRTKENPSAVGHDYVGIRLNQRF